MKEIIDLENWLDEQLTKRMQMLEQAQAKFYRLVDANASMDEISKSLWFTDSYSRLDYIMEAFQPTPDWFELLGDNWSSCDNVRDHADALVEVFKRHKHLTPYLMDEDDSRAFLELPDYITVYRGQDEDYDLGLSWTLDENRAKWFATHAMRYKTDNPVLITAVIHKADIFAVKVGRGEQEVVCMPNIIVRSERLNEEN
jgi:hypothetical protein